MFGKYRYEIDFIKQRDPAARSDIEIFFLYKGFKALRYYRRAHKLYQKGLSEAEFSGRLEDVVFPVYQSAKSMGFSSWSLRT